MVKKPELFNYDEWMALSEEEQKEVYMNDLAMYLYLNTLDYLIGYIQEAQISIDDKILMLEKRKKEEDLTEEEMRMIGLVGDDEN